MLRFWGGGNYDYDIFYELCDKKGILVWHDMMFACAMYPGNEEMLGNIRKETIDNVRRLRNHPSIALWNGNNEVTEFSLMAGLDWLARMGLEGKTLCGESGLLGPQL